MGRHSSTGWVDSTTVPLSLGMTFNARDSDGRTTAMTLAGSRALAMGYDLAGNVTSVTPPAKPAHDFGFDPNNLLASYLPPDGTPTVNPRNTTYTRDKDNLLTLASNPLEPVTYSYDLLGRLLQRTDAATTINTYDASGRLATISSGGVLITNTWDGTMRTAQKTTGPFTKTVNKAYDNFFRVTSWDIDGTNSIALTYDNDNIVTGAGAMTVTTSPNGLLTGTSIGSVSDSWGYDAYGAVTSHSITGSATSYNETITVRDAAGRIGTKTEAIGGVTHTYVYGYDAAGRLTSVKVDGAPSPTRSWTYDGDTTTGNGNRDGGTYDNQDRLTALGSTTYTYSDNGELASKTTSGVTTNYNYDAHGNLRSTSGAVAITYTIDGKNRRVGKTKAGVLQGFVYDGDRIVAELDHTGAELSRFVYATGEHCPDYMIRGGVTYRIVKDHLGSPRLVVNTSNGSIAQHIDYDEWGVATIVGTELNAPFQPFGYAGGLWDRDTGFVRFGARDYDPTAGRWTAKDRARFGGGLNLYGYCSLDPINRVDPSGRYDLTDPAIKLLVAVLATTPVGTAAGGAAVVAAEGAADAAVLIAGISALTAVTVGLSGTSSDASSPDLGGNADSSGGPSAGPDPDSPDPSAGSAGEVCGGPKPKRTKHDKCTQAAMGTPEDWLKYCDENLLGTFHGKCTSLAYEPNPNMRTNFCNWNFIPSGG